MIEAHDEVDTVITGDYTIVVRDDRPGHAGELLRLLPDGRTLLAPDATLTDVVATCWAQVMAMEAENDHLHALVSCLQTEVAMLKAACGNGDREWL